MFAIVYQFKFPGISEAKVAAGFCSESLGGKISEYDFFGLNILISQNGDLNIHLKFDDIASLKKFEQDSDKLLDDLRKSFVFKDIVSYLSRICYAYFNYIGLQNNV